ncbi:HAD family hydrolase [Lichenicola cladoniae]|uniref:HAD family hydrolase n=1 Tax=Lichenicola cladoniae TaxID=1484109 RepID=A0A6M8HTH9_9PROT|nr:Cof-type HAD-IIB family hydrolase [Lichenicola cladoniae]NPD68229.1 HAD family hydrolase [Acetobacteraceae bacterium]QKE91834.1 HAD family hydrolase [Lichenicola cladoniae]
MADLQKISLVLADVDGTLVTKDKLLTERAIRAVQELRRRGIRFAITSGRPPKGANMLIAPLGITEPIAGFNGGLFVKPDLTIIEAKTLPRDAAEKTVQILLDHKVDVWVYSGEDWLVHDNKAPHVSREEWTVKFPPKVVKDFGAALDSVVKIVGISDDLELMKKVEKDAQEALGNTASAARSQPYYLDVTHPDANKGGVVTSLERMLGVKASEIATLGDQPNDVLMFKKSGMSIAMGQASDEVKSQATYVSDSAEDEGFAKAIERYVLGEAS